MTNKKTWVDPIRLENCKIMYKHFSGLKDKYHAQGDRDFTVLIEDLEYARFLQEVGWNIKYPTPMPDIDPENDTRKPSLKVKLNLAGIKPPQVFLISQDRNGNQTNEKMTEETIGIFDSIRFETIDLLIVPYNWTHNDESGISAYVSEFYGVMEPVGFREKYGF